MVFIKKESNVGKKVKLTHSKDALSGCFEKGSVVTIVDCDPFRGYSFIDEFGNKIIECGFSGFEVV